MKKTRGKIAVIGAGISGLTCAYELQKSGFTVDVYEREEQVGGRVQTITNRRLPIDIGANYFNNDVTWIPHYCHELNVPFEKIVKHPTYILRKKKLVSPWRFIGIVTLLRILMIRLKHTRKCNGIYDLSMNPASFDEQDAAHFAQQISTKFHEYLSDSAVTGLFAYRSSEISANILINCICRPLSVLFGGRYYANTMQDLPTAFSRQLDVIHRSIDTITSTKNRVRVANKLYDAAVLTCPTHVKYEGSESQKRMLRNVAYSSTIALTYEVPSTLINFFDMIYIPFVENQRIALLVNGARKYQHKGHATLGIALHESFAKKLMGKTDAHIFKIVKTELLSVAPFLDGKLDMLKPHALKRWPEALVKYPPPYVKMVRAFWNDGQGDNNVYFCGDYMNAPGVEGSIGSGRRVATLISTRHR